MAFTNDVEPLIVDLGQQVAAIKLDRFAETAAIARRPYKCIDVEPYLGIGVPGDLVALDRDVPPRRLGQNFRKLAERCAQFCSRRSFFVVGIKQKGEILTRYRGRAVQ